MLSLYWTPGAVSDLKSLVVYIAKADPGAAKKMAARIKKAVGMLPEFPDIGRMVPEFDNPVVRELLVRPYRVVYKRDPNDLKILAIVHSRRDLDALMEPPK
jgi:plasmid stabilization system protein ParE